MQKRFGKILHRGVALFLGLALLFAVPGELVVVQGAGSYTANGVTLPLKGYGNGAPSYGKANCRAFAGMVYKKIWGTTFTSYRGTNDDMLRNVPTGSARAITVENVKKFISAAALGATIRITTDIRGNDVYGTNLHSQILIQKDDKGFTIYDSIDSQIRVKYYTWEAYVASYGKYKYFKYIKWPDAPAYDSNMEEAPEISVLDMGVIGKYVTIQSEVENAVVYYTTDGSVPTAESTLYTGIFVADAGTEIKAVVVKENYGNSPVATQTISFAEYVCAWKPVFGGVPFSVKLPTVWNPISINRYGILGR